MSTHNFPETSIFERRQRTTFTERNGPYALGSGASPSSSWRPRSDDLHLPPIRDWRTNLLPSPRQARDADLSEISAGPLDIREDRRGFRISVSLQSAILSRGQGLRDVDGLVSKVCDEAMEYANQRKEEVRNALKAKMRRAEGGLSTREKSKLRSRREARVSRTKEREFEQALKSVIRSLVAGFDEPTL